MCQESFSSKFPPSVVTRLLRAKGQQKLGVPRIQFTRWSGRAKGEGCKRGSNSFRGIVLRLPGGAMLMLKDHCSWNALTHLNEFFIFFRQNRSAGHKVRGKLCAGKNHQ